MSQLVSTTAQNVMRPIGSQADRSLARVQAMIAKEFRGEIGFLLAEPVQRTDGAGIDWYTENDEALTQMVKLSPELVDYWRQILQADVAKIEAVAQTYDGLKDQSSRSAATALRNTITYPSEDYVWIAGNPRSSAAALVITGWGYESYVTKVGTSDLGSVVAVALKHPAPLVASGLEDLEGGAVALRQSSNWITWAWWLLWLASIGLALAIAWFMIPACGVKVPFSDRIVWGFSGGRYCRAAVNPQVQLDLANTELLRGQIGPLETALRTLIAQCVPPAPPVAPAPAPEVPPAIADPAAEVKKVLNEHGLAPDPTGTSVTLVWDNKNDLDLYLVCGNDEVSRGGSGCGAKSKLDANYPPKATPVDDPAEYIEAPSLAPGHYSVEVHNFKAAGTLPPTTAYTVILQQGDKYTSYPGTVDLGVRKTVMEFDVP